MSTNVPDPTGDDTADDTTSTGDGNSFIEGYAAGLADLEVKGPLDPFLEGDDAVMDLLGDVPVPRPGEGEHSP